MQLLLKILITSFCFLVLSCETKEATLSNGTNFYGAKITEAGATNFTGIEAALGANDTISIKLSGTIEEVCQSKGCWMTLVDTKGETSIHVKFKDYTFFIPKNASGKKAIIEGKVYVSETPVEELKHYAEDKGATPDEISAITTTKKEIKMMADGVIIFSD